MRKVANLVTHKRNNIANELTRHNSCCSQIKFLRNVADESRASAVQVVTFVDGIGRMSTTMDYKLRQSAANVDNVFYIGHSLLESKGAGESGSCQLGNLFLFKGQRFDIFQIYLIEHFF